MKAPCPAEARRPVHEQTRYHLPRRSRGPSRYERSDVSLYRRHALRGVYERQGSDTLAGTALARGARLAPVFAELNKYDATTHFVGQSTIFSLRADRATGEAYCLAHHVTVDGTKRRLMVASLRYLDTFVKMDSSWLFAERRLYVDWLEKRALS